MNKVYISNFYEIALMHYFYTAILFYIHSEKPLNVNYKNLLL